MHLLSGRWKQTEGFPLTASDDGSSVSQETGISRIPLASAKSSSNVKRNVPLWSLLAALAVVVITAITLGSLYTTASADAARWQHKADGVTSQLHHEQAVASQARSDLTAAESSLNEEKDAHASCAIAFVTMTQAAKTMGEVAQMQNDIIGQIVAGGIGSVDTSTLPAVPAKMNDATKLVGMANGAACK